MAEKLITKSFERLLDKGKYRGFITYEELGKSLGKRNSTNENIERAFIILVDEKVTLVEKKSQYQSNKKKETTAQAEEKTSDKSDDPIRMYLREMGGVELLSREGEIAIAKRIEAGKDVMINALTQSPIVGKKIFEWKEQIENQQLLVRDIIDIDSTYEDFESSDEEDEIKVTKKAKEVKENKNEEKKQEEDTSANDEDEFNVSLAKMEEEIKPKIIAILESLNKNYSKLKKYQVEKLECLLNSKELSVSKNKNFKKIQEILVDNFKNLQLAPHVVEELVQNSDTAIHYAKGMGSCHYRVYNDQMRLRSKERLTLENALHKALERNELIVYYQPKVCLQTQKIIGSEALLRWNHPTLGFVSPGEFIPIAEETGLIIPIGFWTTEQACKQNKIWQEEGYSDLSISVNFSNRLLSHNNLEKTLINAFEKTKLEPNFFDIEITEDIFLQDPAQVHSTLTKLTNLGSSISIDDFGTGYSSFSYLKKFPISNLKIDRSFISDVTTNKDARAIVKAIIAMAKGLKVKVIAEGVETKEQLKFLESLKCEEVQGFYFSKPLPPDQFQRLIQTGIQHQF